LPWAERVIVKIGSGGNAAASLHPTPARELIHAAAERAVNRAAAGELARLVVDRPTSIEVDYAKAVQADFAAIVPGAERIGDRGVRHVGEDPVGAYRGFLAGFRLAGLVD
jgi:D-amino peptidase